GVTRPKNFLPSVALPSKVFTFLRKHSPKFSGRITPLTPSMLEVATALAAKESNSASTHSRAEITPRDDQGTPTQSAAQASLSTDIAQGATAIPTSPNDYTPTDASQTSGGDEGLLDLYAMNMDHYVQDDTADPFFEDIVDKDAAVTPDIERKSDETEALERKSDETEEINV
ncbi:hypothetical protein Tco_1280449, partial [Tanacetum coccineum]